jgi:hypothetical protein
MFLEICVDFCLGGTSSNNIRGYVLSFRVSAVSSARIDGHEGFVFFGVFSHLVHDLLANLAVVVLRAINLVGKGIEETVSCKKSAFTARNMPRCGKHGVVGGLVYLPLPTIAVALRP